MKKPVNLKVDYFLEKYRYLKFILIALIIILGIGGLAYLFIIASNSIQVTSSLVGVFGAVLGAFVGGSLAFIGSIYVNNNQLKSKSAIYRKNVIYKPLYDELITNKNILEEENSYPYTVNFTKVDSHGMNWTEYSAWNRIKNDSRYIQTPKFLAHALDDLNIKIQAYLDSLSSGAEDVHKKLEEILIEQLGFTNNIRNLGSSLLNIILQENNEPENLIRYVYMNYKNELSKEEVIRIENLIYEECNNIESLKEIKEKYKSWLQAQDELIDTLTKIIIVISNKYEKHSTHY